MMFRIRLISVLWKITFAKPTDSPNSPFTSFTYSLSLFHFPFFPFTFSLLSNVTFDLLTFPLGVPPDLQSGVKKCPNLFRLCGFVIRSKGVCFFFYRGITNPPLSIGRTFFNDGLQIRRDAWRKTFLWHTLTFPLPVPIFLRRDVAIPASRRNNSRVAT